MKKMNGENLIFIISQPRSGSTLLQRILSAHSQICTSSEPWLALPLLWNDPLDNFRINKKVPFNNKWTESAIKAGLFETSKNIDLKKHLSQLYEAICQDYCMKEKKHFYLDKTPRYYYILDEIQNYFPKAKIIIIIRNPLAVLNSIINTWVGKRYYLLKQFKDDLFLAPEIFSKAIHKKTNNIFYIRYEDLISQTELEINKILDYIGLNYEDCLARNMKRNHTKYKYGDPINSTKFKMPKQDFGYNWIKDLKEYKKWSIINDYKEYLGSQMLDALGYSYEGLGKILQANKPRKRLITFSLHTYMKLPFNFYLLEFFKIMGKGKNSSG